MTAVDAGALEAVLLVCDEPVAVATLAEVLDADADAVLAGLDALAAEHRSRAAGIELRATDAGWRLHTRPEHVEVVERYLREGQRVRLTQAGLEVLAVVAYAQPTTRGHVSAVRGVASDGALRTLVGRGLVEEAGAEPVSGAVLYRTTPLFLERLGVGSLAELPALAPHLPELAELAPAGTGRADGVPEPAPHLEPPAQAADTAADLAGDTAADAAADDTAHDQTAHDQTAHDQTAHGDGGAA